MNFLLTERKGYENWSPEGKSLDDLPKSLAWFFKEELDIIQKNVYVDLTFPPPLAAKIFPELPQVSLLIG